MSHYKANLRDIEFNLFEVFGAGNRLGRGPYAELDGDTIREVLREIRGLCEGPLAESFVDADRNPPKYDPATMSVRMPESFQKSFAALMGSGFWRLDIPEHMGGSGAPPSIRWSVAEMILGANPALYMYMSGPGFASIVDSIGTDEQKAWAQIMVDREWGATMVLTEPDAGSDVGAGRTKAFPQPDGSWHIEGVKRFITSGEHDMAENIVHLVLARPEGVAGEGGPGTKGLSLFFVPKHHFDAEGNIGARNGAFVTNVEKKMGLKVSTTCEITFGQHGIPAKGWLIGDVHDGIAQMFKVIEYARMMVGTKAIATLSTGYLNALEYAKNRVQGPDLTQMMDKRAPRVAITAHPDVRRSLMLQKSYAEGMRALIHMTSYYQDQIDLAARGGAPEVDPEMAHRVNDLLLPIVKGVGSERSYELLATSLQTFGGSGFLQDYPIEQYIRDAKIDTLYEGTTAIQGLDFFFRKMLRDQFKAVMHLGGQVAEFVKADPGESLTHERELLGRALEDVQAVIGVMGGWAMASQANPTEIYKVGLNTTRLLLMMGDVVIGYLLLRQAEVAEAALAAGASAKDTAFYQGKVAAAKWFAANRLPLLSGERVVVETTSLDVMEVPEASF
ncbi:MAG: acyl-CoA dehydrogenase [Candidatus Nanopelagicales bacterium]